MLLDITMTQATDWHFLIIFTGIGLFVSFYFLLSFCSLLSDRKSTNLNKLSLVIFAIFIISFLLCWHFYSLQILSFFVLSVLFRTPKYPYQKKQDHSVNSTVNADLLALKQENTLLKKRIQETPETFASQLQFFQSLLTLNEIQFVQALVESAARFLKAIQVSFYHYSPKAERFTQSAHFHTDQGLSFNDQIYQKDRLLYLIRESRSILSIQEILHNKRLYRDWQNSYSKALIYCPIHAENQFRGILTVDKIKFHNLNHQTIRNAKTIGKLAAVAFKNIKIHQNSLTEKEKAQSKLLTEYQQFLKTLNYEFKRAKRGDLNLSLIFIVLENSEGQPISSNEGIRVAKQIRQSCRNNLREVDLIFDDNTLGRIWVVLPMTDFNGLAYVLERLNLIINMDLAEQTKYVCHLGFSSLDQGNQQPLQMITTCKESYQLHRTVKHILTRQRKRNKISTL